MLDAPLLLLLCDRQETSAITVGINDASNSLRSQSAVNQREDAMYTNRELAPRTALPSTTLRETLSVVLGVILPTIAKGVIIRRKSVMAIAERLDLDRRAVKVVQRLRDRYGRGPLVMRTPIRTQAIILDPDHVHRVLDESPEPFAAASAEKRAALAHFQPQGVLISHGPERTERRAYNEAVLETGNPLHSLARHFNTVVAEEADLLLGAVRHREELIWEDFARTWLRVVRRVVFGDTARNDQELYDLLNQLRADANWAFFKPQRHTVREQFYARLQPYLDVAAPQSLAGVMAQVHATETTFPAQQVPQWLFAFDPAGMATFRALALLATHPLQADQARAEVQQRAQQPEPDLPFLRACVLESLRLWPTTPMVLRQTTRETAWEEGVLEAGAGVLIFAPFFHRDETRLPAANQFTPEIWLQQRTHADWPLIPFSDGPVMCPGRNLVLLVSSAMLARMIGGHTPHLVSGQHLNPAWPLPGTLSPFELRIALDEMERPAHHS